jgi:uncharacterized OB-fold protein
MAKHQFRDAGDKAGNIVGVLCVKCGKTFEFENLDIPENAKNEECKPEDFSQAAARIVRAATEK